MRNFISVIVLSLLTTHLFSQGGGCDVSVNIGGQTVCVGETVEIDSIAGESTFSGR